MSTLNKQTQAESDGAGARAGADDWRAIVDRDGSLISDRYEVSSAGAIRSWLRSGRSNERADRPRYLKGNIQYRAHINVALRVDGLNRYRFIHQLVAWAFLGPQPTEYPMVRHADGDPANNEVSNLRYGTARDNYIDRYRSGLGVGHRGTPVFLVQDDVDALVGLAPTLPLKWAQVLQGIVEQYEANKEALTSETE